MRKKQGVFLAGVLAGLLLLAVSGCSKGGAEAGLSRSSSQSREAETKERVTQAAAAETGSTFLVGKMGDDFILPDVGTHVYTPEELSGLTPAELRIARNEIYARHGRRFKSQDLNDYFSGKAWYQGLVDPDRFDTGILSQNEKDNLNVLQHQEDGRTVCAIPKIGVEEFPRIDGSTATIPLSQAIYRMSTGALAGEAEAAIEHSKTTWAWESLIAGPDRGSRGVDLVIAYEPGESVDEALKKSGVQIIKKPIGRDALVFLANQSNPVRSLSQSQIVDIYTGKIKNWKSVGGKNRSIEAFQRPEDSGSQNIMNKLVMKGRKMADAPMDHVVGEMGDLIDRVSAYDNTGDALGYSVYYYARNMYRKPGLAFMAVDGVSPSSETIRDGSYPYVNEFYAAVRADEPKDSKAYQLFDWLTSEDGQSLINGLGYVGIKNSAKQLPQGLLDTGTDHAFTGVIPLPTGTVILASGSYLYGEQGIAVFDSGMNLLKFVNHVDMQDDWLKESPKDAVIYAQDTRTGEDGYYSISEDRWVNQTSGQDYDQGDHWYDDWEGTWDDWVAAQGEAWTGWLAGQGESREELEKKYDRDAIAFAYTHPDILKQYGAALDQVQVRYYGESSPLVLSVKEGNLEHYYDGGGHHLLDYDTQGRADEELPARSVFPVDDHTAYLCLRQWGSDDAQYRVYRDGVLFKNLSDNQDGEIRDVERNFYTRIRGNFLYFYNYQDEPCAKFLLGWDADD